MSKANILHEFANKPREVHAFGMGAAAGLFAALLRDTGYEKVAYGLMGAVWALALGIRGAKKYIPLRITNKDIKNEPHYAVSGTALGFMAGLVVGMYVEV